MSNQEIISKNFNVLKNVISIVVSEKSVEEKLNSILRIIKNYYACLSCGIVLYEEDKNQFELKGFLGISHHYKKKFQKSQDTDLLLQVLETDEVIALPTDGKYSKLNEIKFEHDYQTLLCKSLKMANTTFGLCFITSPKSDAFNEDLVSLFNILAELASISLYNLLLSQNYNKLLDKALLIDQESTLYNIRVFHNVIERELERARLFNHKLSLILINIDHYRQYIAINGEEMGVQMIQDIADIIRKEIRKFDVAAHYHDKPVVILPEMGKDQAIEIAKNIKQAVNAFEFDSSNPRTQVSISVATYPDDAESESQLMSILNKNIYKAIRDGGNTIKT